MINIFQNIFLNKFKSLPPHTSCKCVTELILKEWENVNEEVQEAIDAHWLRCNPPKLYLVLKDKDHD